MHSNKVSLQEVFGLKKFLALVMTIILTCSGLSVSARDLFTDVPETDWAAPYIYNLVDRGVVGGYGDGTFKPWDNVQRCEYAKMLVNIADINIVSSSVSPYTDVPADQWFFPYINSAPFITGYVENGILFFAPEDAASREDVTVAMIKVLGINVVDTATATEYLSARFSDWQSISTHNLGYIAAAVNAGIITGDADGTFRPGAPIIRAEVVAVLYRAFPDEHNVEANKL